MGRDTISGTFWFCLAFYVAFESWRLGIGGLHNPGPGFLSFSAALVVGIFSLAVLNRPFLAWEEREEAKTSWKNNGLVILALIGYASLLEQLGFVVTALFFIGILLKVVERKRWLVSMIFSLLTALTTYGVFQIWLKSQLPKGIFGF